VADGYLWSDAVIVERAAPGTTRLTSKEGKQAEFLMHHAFPWHLVERIGVCSREAAQRAVAAIAVRRDWYY
jgi:hypothetical protein